MTLTVIWPLYEILDFKEEIIVHAGGFVDWDDVIATQLEVVVRGQVMELTDDDIRGLVSEREYNLMHRERRWSLNPGYVFPIRGLVLECKHCNNSTLLDIHVIGQAPCDIGNALEVQAVLPLPSFWADVEIKDHWRKLCPNSHRQWEIRRQRPATDTREAIEARGAVATLYSKHHCLDNPTFAQYTGYAETKLSYAERQRNRLAQIRNVRLCIFETNGTPAPGDVLLSESRHETLLAAESFCFFAMAALDLLARAVDHLLSITVSPKQRRSRATFAGLLGTTESEEEGEEAKKTLISQFPNLPITRLWQSAWAEWIQPLAQRRHSLTHDSILQPIEVAHGGVSFTDELPDSADITDLRMEDALEFADQVLAKLRNLCRESFILIAQIAQEWSTNDTVDLPTDYPPDLNLREWSPTNYNLEEALNAWIAVSAGDNGAVETFYHRVHANLKKSWSLPQCQSLLQSNRLQSYRVTQGRSSTDGQYGQINRALVRMVLEEREIDVWFSVVQARSDRWHIIREPISTFPDPHVRLECTEMWRRQSGPESGYRDVVYGGRVRNSSDQRLSNITMTLCRGGAVADYSDLQITEIGQLNPGESIDFEGRYENGCMPPFGFRLLSEPASLRFCYDLPDGQRYAADFPYDGPAQRGERIGQ